MDWLFGIIAFVVFACAWRIATKDWGRVLRRRHPRNGITKSDLAALLEKFKTEACAHCGGLHAIACPRVKHLSFAANGGVSSVEFWPWNQWPRDDIEFPHELLARPVIEEADDESG